MFIPFLKRLVILFGFVSLCVMICYRDNILIPICAMPLFLAAMFLVLSDDPKNSQKSIQQDNFRQPFANNKYWQEVTSRKAELYQGRYMRLVKKYTPEFGSYGLSEEQAIKYIDDLAQNGFAVKSLEILYAQKKHYLGFWGLFNRKSLPIGALVVHNHLAHFYYDVPRKILFRHNPVFESTADVKSIILKFPQKIEYVLIHPHIPDQWLETPKKED